MKMAVTTTTQTQSTTMNEATMTQAVADLVTCANLGVKQGMDSTIDHTGAYPTLVADGGIAHTTQAQAFSALQRYLVNVKAAWAWADTNLAYGDMTPASAQHLGKETYPVKRGPSPRTVGTLAYGLMKVRRETMFALRAAKNAAAIAEAEANGGAWFAEGVCNKDGEPVKYATAAKASKAWAREHFGATWWEGPDKAGRLAQAVVQQGSPVTTLSEDTLKVRAVQAPAPATTPAPTANGTTFTGATEVAATPTPVEIVTSDQPTVTLSDETLIGMATGAGYGSRGGVVTIEGAKLYLRSKGVNC